VKIEHDKLLERGNHLSARNVSIFIIHFGNKSPVFFFLPHHGRTTSYHLNPTHCTPPQVGSPNSPYQPSYRQWLSSRTQANRRVNWTMGGWKCVLLVYHFGAHHIFASSSKHLWCLFKAVSRRVRKGQYHLVPIASSRVVCWPIIGIILWSSAKLINWVRKQERGGSFVTCTWGDLRGVGPDNHHNVKPKAETLTSRRVGPHEKLGRPVNSVQKINKYV